MKIYCAIILKFSYFYFCFDPAIVFPRQFYTKLKKLSWGIRQESYQQRKQKNSDILRFMKLFVNVFWWENYNFITHRIAYGSFFLKRNSTRNQLCPITLKFGAGIYTSETFKNPKFNLIWTTLGNIHLHLRTFFTNKLALECSRALHEHEQLFFTCRKRHLVNYCLI